MMAKKVPPKDDREREEREVRGLWKAIAYSKRLGEQREELTIADIRRVHELIFTEAHPDIAGRFRHGGEDVEPLECTVPPPGRMVAERMMKFWLDLNERVRALPLQPEKERKRKQWFMDVIRLAAWAQHGLVEVHPFCDGNGRVGRLLTNIILSRFGLPPSRVRMEGENKPAYLSALCQIDKYRNYEALAKIIARSVLENYEKEAKVRKEAQRRAMRKA